MKKAFNLKISKLNSFFAQKNNLLIYLLIFLGVIIPVSSFYKGLNIWEKIFIILTDPFFNLLFFIAMGLTVINMMSYFSKSFNIISRCIDYKKVIKENIHDIILYTSYLMLIALILVIAGSIIFSFGNIEVINHPSYGLNIIYYLLFFIIRNTLLSIIVNTIMYLLFVLLKKSYALILILLNSFLFLMLPSIGNVVNHFYNFLILYHYFFRGIEYSSFGLEIICSFIEILFLFIVYKIIMNIVTSKKRDLI